MLHDRNTLPLTCTTLLTALRSASTASLHHKWISPNWISVLEFVSGL